MPLDTAGPSSLGTTWYAPETHTWFDWWLLPATDVFSGIIKAIIADVEHFERTRDWSPRIRSRRPPDQVKFEAIVTAIIMNMAHMALVPSLTGRLAVATRNGDEGASRYDHPTTGRQPREVMDSLDVLGYVIKLKPRAIRGEVTSVQPGPKLLELLWPISFTIADFQRDQSQEVLILRHTTTGSDSFWMPRWTRREQVNYDETKETTAIRGRIQHLNAFLAAADITFIDDGLSPAVDSSNRLMRRYFIMKNGDTEQRFDQSGRLFGGFWQGLKSVRRSQIRINGEEVVNLDFSSMFTRLAYAELGQEAPEGDLYAIEGLEGYRSGVKLAMNAFLFDMGGTRKSWPKELGVGLGSDEDAVSDSTGPAAQCEVRLPAGWTVARTRRAILQRHPHLATAWNKGLGYRLMYLESVVLMETLTQLCRQNIPALGLHDGLMVAKSQAKQAQDAMNKACLEVIGRVIPVAIKPC